MSLDALLDTPTNVSRNGKLPQGQETICQRLFVQFYDCFVCKISCFYFGICIEWAKSYFVNTAHTVTVHRNHNNYTRRLHGCLLQSVLHYHYLFDTTLLTDSHSAGINGVEQAKKKRWWNRSVLREHQSLTER